MHVFHTLGITVICLGPLVTAITLRDALLDRRALRRAGINGVRRQLVHQSIRHEALRFAKHLVLALALIAGDGIGLSARDIALTGVSLILSINSVLDVRDRRRAMERLRFRGSMFG